MTPDSRAGRRSALDTAFRGARIGRQRTGRPAVDHVFDHETAMNPKALLERVTAQIDRSQGVQIMVPHDTGCISLGDDFLHGIDTLLEESIELMQEVVVCYEAKTGKTAPVAAGGGDDPEAGLMEIGAQIASELATREIADLAFFGRRQLVDARGNLQRARDRQRSRERDNVWEIISHADTGLRRMGKALIALESAMREYEGLAPIERHWEDLEDALEIRRTYGQFRRAILRGGEELGPAGPAGQLRNAARRIAILRDRKIYPYLRIDDRRQIRSFQKQIAAWLERTDEAADEDGGRLWQDLVAFSRLLTQVNHREELREHDRELVARTIYRLFTHRPPPSEMPAEVLASLDSLFGRDDQLDQMLLQPHAHPPADWREPLMRIQTQLDQPFTGDLSTL